MTKWMLIAAGVRWALSSLRLPRLGATDRKHQLSSRHTGGQPRSAASLIGFLTATFTGPKLIREEYRIGIIVGILGGFTTFSTFGWETFSLTNDRQFAFAALECRAQLRYRPVRRLGRLSRGRIPVRSVTR